MTKETGGEKFEGSVRTLGIFQARHLISRRISKQAQFSSLNREQLLTQYSQNDFLSPEEVRLCVDEKMKLPYPLKAPWPTEKQVSIDLWNIKLWMEIEAGKRVYIVTGFFDGFHGGHWSLVNNANMLANFEKTYDQIVELFGIEAVDNFFNGDDHISNLVRECKKSKDSESSMSGGVVVARLEDDDYKVKFKDQKPIFSNSYRAGWFEQLPVKWVTTYPVSSSKNESWDFGNLLIRGAKEGVDIKNRMIFVLPLLPENEDKQEVRAVDMRVEQIRRFGFGVVKVPSFISDVSSSKLVEKFSLDPVEI